LIIRKVISSPTFFWGWIMVAIAATFLGANTGTSWYANSVYLVPLQRYFGTERTVISQAFALTHLVAMGVFPILGALLDRWGPRRILIIGLAGMAVTHLLLSRMTALWQFYVLILVQQSLFMRCNEPMTAQALLGRWFVRLRGRASGLAMAGVGVGGMVLPSLAGVLIDRFGWRSGYLMSGILMGALVLPAVILLVINNPEEIGQHKDGAALAPPITQSQASGFTFAQALPTWRLWALAINSAVWHVGFGIVSLQMPAILQGAGLTVSASAAFLGVMLGISTAGRLVIGALTDRFDTVRILGFALLGTALGAAMLFWPASAAARIGFIILYGLASGGVYTVMPLTVQSAFGLKTYGRIYAVVFVTGALGMSAGNYLGAWLYDWQGNYTSAIWLAVGTTVAAALLAFTLKPRKWLT